jgi:hypothetical protein
LRRALEWVPRAFFYTKQAYLSRFHCKSRPARAHLGIATIPR